MRNVALALTAILLASCSHSYETNQLVGEWRHSSAETSVDLTFLQDGMFEAAIEDRGVLAGRAGGHWSLSDNILNYQYRFSTIPGLSEDARDRDKIIEISKTNLALKTSNGEIHNYVRIH